MKKILLLFVCITAFSFSHDDKKAQKLQKKNATGCALGTDTVVLNANNITVDIFNSGTIWNGNYKFNKTNSNPFTQIPLIASGGIWIGGTDQPNGGNNLLNVNVFYLLR